MWKSKSSCKFFRIFFVSLLWSQVSAHQLCDSSPSQIHTSDLPNIKHLCFFFLSGFPGQTSCLDTGGPTRVSSPTSVQCVRRSLHAVTTCQNTSKSTVFHEAAGQFAQQTDLWDLWDHWECWEHSYRHRPQEQGVSCECTGVCTNVCAFIKSVWICEWKHALLFVSAVWACFNLLYKSKPTQLPFCNQLKVIVAVGALVCCTPYVCSVLIACLSRR